MNEISGGNSVNKFNGKSTTGFRKIAAAVVMLFGLAPVMACANAGDGSDENANPDQPPIATVNEDPISLEDVDRKIKDDLFSEKFPSGKGDAALYQARREAIDQIVDERLIAGEAAKAQLTEAEWLAAKLTELPEVTDAEVQAFYTENQSRFAPGTTLETLSGPIREYLGQSRETGIREGLRDSATVVVSLPRERKTVAAVGYALGPETAPVTIVEFSDFQCPYCSRVVPTIKEIAARYPEQVRIVFRHLPLSFHENARIAAYGSICAGNQDRFWDYHDLLFANQRALGREQLFDYATTLSLDMEQFEACMNAPETEATVANDLRDAEELGASGTPAFFINGIFLSGAQPVEAFDELIQQEIANPQG
jgi:protein-disulfide isomerase